MSGLVAVFRRDGRPVRSDDVSEMVNAVPHRGPDGVLMHLDGAVGLALARHIVTPEDRLETQPLQSPRTGCVIVADVRLDNRDEVQALLRTAPSQPIGDAELILRGYEAWGPDVASRLLGDFAFVIWDPGQRRMVCSRDSSGQRQLFYRSDHRSFTAASEIHQLLCDPSVPIAANDARIREFLVPANVYRNEKDGASTFYEGIVAVPAGHTLTVTPTAMTVAAHWTFEPTAAIRYRHPDQYAEHYADLFSKVVQARLRTAGPVGILLSGGLDSSSIACVAQVAYRSGRAVDHGFTSFSTVYDGLECDERPFIEEMQAMYGFRAEFIPWEAGAGRLEAEPSTFLEAPNAGIRSMRDKIFGAADAAGVQVVLTGDIADACVYGSRIVFDAFLRRGDIRGFWRHFRAFRRGSSESLLRTVALSCVSPLLPLAVQKQVMAAFVERATRRAGTRLLPTWMPDPFRVELAERHRALCLAAERSRRFANPSLHDDMCGLYPPEVARHPTPWPIQIWRPFADRRLHQFLLAIPPDQKFEPHPETDSFYAGSKWLVRRAMRGILPEGVRTQTTKTVFTAAHEPEIAAQWSNYAKVFGPGSRPRIAARGYVDAQQFWARLQALRAGSTGTDLLYVQQLVALETWLRSLELPRSRLAAAPARAITASTLTSGPMTARATQMLHSV